MSATRPASTARGNLDVSPRLLASVIIPVRNGGQALNEVLASLAAQTLPQERFEVLIGDDGSRDGATQGLETPDGRVRVLPGPPRNSYAARNRAAAQARGDAIVFCDVDCRPEPEWLAAGLAALRGVELVAGAVRFIVPARPTTWTLLDMDFFLNQELAVRRGRAATANLFVSRELFERIGGFDETLPNGSDWDFVRRCVNAGARLKLAEAAVVWHPTRDHARSFLRKVWNTSRTSGVRQARSGQGPGIRSLSFWLPPYSMLRSRRWDALPLSLDGRRLALSGIELGLRDHLRAVPLMYVVVAFVWRSARTVGWLQGRFARPSARP